MIARTFGTQMHIWLQRLSRSGGLYEIMPPDSNLWRKPQTLFCCDCPALAGLGCKLQRDIWLQDGEATILRKTGSEGVIRLNSASLVLPTEVTVLEACIIKTAHCGAHWAPRKGRCRLLTYTTSALLNRTSRRRLLSPLLTRHGQFHFAFIVNRLKP